MDRDVFDALSRLDLLLPLAEHQAQLPEVLYRVHRFCLQSLQQRGCMPDTQMLARLLINYGVRRGIHALADLDLLVLDGNGVPVGAYPMTEEETPHRLQLPGTVVYAMCAIDALAVAPMFSQELIIHSCCHETGEAIRIHQRGMHLLSVEPHDEVYTGIRWQDTASCAAHTLCREMVFLRDADSAACWQENLSSESTLLSLSRSIELAAAFFLPLVQERMTQ